MATKVYNTIEDIIKMFNNKKLEGVVSITKYDGITIEFKTSTNDVSSIVSKIQSVCKDKKLTPISVEYRKDDDTTFIVQFPQLDVKYSDEQIKLSYKDIFKFLIDNSKLTRPSLTKSEILQYKSLYVKHSITYYCRMNTNPYRITLSDCLSNSQYVNNILNMFIQYINEEIK